MTLTDFRHILVAAGSQCVVGTISPDFDVNGDGVVNAFESAGGEVGGNVFLVATRRWPSRTATSRAALLPLIQGGLVQASYYDVENGSTGETPRHHGIQFLADLDPSRSASTKAVLKDIS